jgi:hypothetical protein
MTPPLARNDAGPVDPTVKNKDLVQYTIDQLPSPVSFKSVTVPSFRKKNGTLVDAHIRLVQVNRSQPPQKISPIRSKNLSSKKRHIMNFLPCQRDASVTLAYSLRIADVQKLMRVTPKSLV